MILIISSAYNWPIKDTHCFLRRALAELFLIGGQNIFLTRFDSVWAKFLAT